MSKIIESFVKGFEKPSTQRQYRAHLNTFFENLNIEPDTYFSNGRDYQQDLLDYWTSLKDYAPCTRSGKITAARQFLEENDIVISRKIWNIIKRQKKRIPKNIDHVPTPSELKSILQHGGVKEKSLFLVLCSSGIRIDEALNITLNDIQLTDERGNIISPAKIKIRQEISKNDTPRIAFMSDEARDILLEWFKIRTEYLEASVKKLAKRHIQKKLDDDRVFPFAWATAWTMWSRLLTKSKFNKKNKITDKTKLKHARSEDRYEIHIHTLRKFMMNRMKGVTRIDAVEQLAGHEGYLDKSYRRLDESELIEAYKLGMPSVTIFQNPVDLSGINESLKEKDEQIETMKKEMEKMQNEIYTLQNLEVITKLLIKQEKKKD
jgi:integrase